MLLKYLGTDRFWAGINRYLRDHAYDVATSDDLRQAFLAATGENLDWFWDQWVYQAGYPEFSVQAAWDSAGGTLNLTVRQEQQDTLAADSTGLRFTVPDVFHMPMTVRVGTSTGDVVFRTRLESKEQTLQIPGITTPPTMVIFDDGNTILKRLSFPEPTEWLAEQLRRDPDLWNRAWVIAQLAERKDDPTALEALGTAATGSDYFLTRSQAARALAAFDDPKAASALLAALRDSSAQVRVAAAQALGGFGTDPVVAAIRTAWQRDTSYAVRAAALGTLARLDQAHAQELIREGLRTPSYRNVFQAGDTTMLDDVDGVMGVAPNAPFVLAAFAGRGNQRALSLLEGHLTAPRVVIRKRVLEAFRFAMPPALARERLTVKLAEVQNARVREEIAEALGRIKP
jgi:aminopeptidase N